ncbi:MAG TPA: MarR family transcriptional regulator [Candidatus Polarisedimenticolia bacterium]|nr:MarR family transcriptional regulator [Candidatus Polarisedimenticolia bacterium]
MVHGANGHPREVANRLHSAAIHLLRRARRTDPLTGVSPAQLSALSVLMSGPKTLGDLAAAEQVRPPTMSRLVSEMQRAGVARKVTDREDARVVRVHATPKGLRALSRGRAMRIESIEQLMTELGPDELGDVERAVGAIEKLLGQRAPSARR